MCLNRIPLSARCYKCSIALLTSLTIACALSGRGFAQPTYDDVRTPAGWAWAQISHGNDADFNKFCKTKTSPDPRQLNDALWNADCRRLPSSFVTNVLTRDPWRGRVPSSGVRIIGAKIVGDIDLHFANLNRALVLEQCRIEDNIDFTQAHTASVIRISGSRIAGVFTALELHSELSLELINSEFTQDVFLSDANTAGSVNMEGSTLEGNLLADGLQVGGYLFLRSSDQNKAIVNDVRLVSAKVTGNFDMGGATLTGTLDADALQVDGTFFMNSIDKYQGRFKDVRLTTAKVTGNFDMGGATIEGALTADSLQVEGSLFMNSTPKYQGRFNDVSLAATKVTGDIVMDGATINGSLNADALNVDGTVFMRNATFAKPISMVFARVGINLDVRGGSPAALDLSGASVGGYLMLGGGKDAGPAHWHTQAGQDGDLILVNTHVQYLMDSKDAWPNQEHLHLDGFTFDHLGSYDVASGSEVRNRDMQWWDDLIRRDKFYSPTPYEQLALAFVATGDRGASDKIRYLGRVRQRESESGWRWAFDGFLQYAAGFGIGNYTFRVLYWVIGFSIAGAAYLWMRVPDARSHGLAWCVGAALDRLLPGNLINKEFADFFNDPERKRLTGWQAFVFSVVAMVGWVLGAILVAAVSGLTQKT
jgi:cytoskeletal protein CcmA (bactofilin family)